MPTEDTKPETEVVAEPAKVLNTWVWDEDAGDWRFYTGEYTGVVWSAPDGWSVALGDDLTKKIIMVDYGHKSLEEGQKFAEELIKKQAKTNG